MHSTTAQQEEAESGDQYGASFLAIQGIPERRRERHFCGEKFSECVFSFRSGGDAPSAMEQAVRPIGRVAQRGGETAGILRILFSEVLKLLYTNHLSLSNFVW